MPSWTTWSGRINPFRALRLARWVAGHAIPVEIADVESAAREDVEKLAWLDPLLEGKRFAFVGEPNHFVHEKLGYRLFALRYFASRGFTVLLEELAWSDGARIDRYLETGDETWLARVGTFGFEGDARPDRDDRWTGYLAQGREHYPTAALKAEHVRWLRALRELCPRLRHFGFDVDYQPGAGYAHLGELDPELRALAERAPGESLAAEVERLERLVAALESRAAGAAQLRTARSLRDGFRYTALVKDAPDLESLRPGMAFRERVMHEQVDDVVAALPEARFIVFAHDLHLARDDARVAGVAGVGPGGGQVDSIGTHVARRHPGRVLSLWMLDCDGRDSQPLVSLGNRVRAPRGSLNRALAPAGESYFVPVRGPLAGRHRVAFMYGVTAQLDLGAQADALYFARRVSPLRER